MSKINKDNLHYMPKIFLVLGFFSPCPAGVGESLQTENWLILLQQSNELNSSSLEACCAVLKGHDCLVSGDMSLSEYRPVLRRININEM